MASKHGVSSSTRFSARAADDVARLMAGLGTASRVRILGRLRERPCSVGELCEAVEMAQPAVSHQLRVLRDLRLVVGVRDGRRTVYCLYDPHVAVLLDEALRHVEHLRTGTPEAPEVLARLDRSNGDRSTMTDEHAHHGPHAHEHDHDDAAHSHAHTEHDHEHVEHDHEHAHDGETHTHEHAHQAGLEQEHEHSH
ncbi:MAG: winged helix-turn-helix transcriptional regulator [Solirubrobacterales bacterium]|nr:winged helix-turn-helix transcriptional regulator [Solirubrobacterales bacterium]